MDVVVAASPVVAEPLYEEPIFAQPGTPGLSIQFALHVDVKDESELPNGTYFTGGPVKATIAPMNAFVPRGLSGRDLQFALHEVCVQRLGESFYDQKTTTTRSNMRVKKIDMKTNALPYERTGPNTVSAESGLGMKIVAQVFIRIDRKSVV